MPELPEVETVVRALRAPLIGRRVESFWLGWPRTLASPDPDQFEARIVGQTFRGVERRAKYIVCQLDDDLLIVHLKMTGRLYVTPAEDVQSADRWVHFKLGLDGDQELRFSDARKFGKVFLSRDFTSIGKGAAALGPEPLEDDFTLDIFRERLSNRKTVIKALLLDQSFVAGIGNIYADEALFRARIHPLRRANSLSASESAALYETVRAALRDGIAYEGASIQWYRKPDGSSGESQDHFFAYGRDGQPCPNCGTTLSKIRVAQRGTHLCLNCQKLD